MMVKPNKASRLLGGFPIHFLLLICFMTSRMWSVKSPEMQKPVLTEEWGVIQRRLLPSSLQFWFSEASPADFLPSLIEPDSEKNDITPTAAALTLISIVPRKTINELLVVAVSSRNRGLHTVVETMCVCLLQAVKSVTFRQVLKDQEELENDLKSLQCFLWKAACSSVP